MTRMVTEQQEGTYLDMLLVTFPFPRTETGTVSPEMVQTHVTCYTAQCHTKCTTGQHDWVELFDHITAYCSSLSFTSKKF